MREKLTTLLFTTLAMLCLASCDADNAKSKKNSSSNITVKVLPATYSNNISTTAYVGTVKADKTNLITSATIGTLAELCVKKGDVVKAGQKLAYINSERAQATYDIAKATYEQAQDGMNRLQKIYETGSISEVKMVEMQTNLSKAEASYKAAQKTLDESTIKSPFNGTVDDIMVNVGEEISLAAPLIRIVDISNIEIQFPLPENEFNKINIGDKAVVQIPALNRETTATLKSKGVVASQIAHSYECTLNNIANKADLMPGMVCKVFIKSNETSGFIIPASAILTDNNGRYIWTVSDSIVGKVYVKVDGYSGNGIVVSEGVTEGMNIVIKGARKISTGMKVNTIE